MTEYCLRNKETGEYQIAKIGVTVAFGRGEDKVGVIVVQNDCFGQVYDTFDEFYEDWEIVGAQSCTK